MTLTASLDLTVPILHLKPINFVFDLLVRSPERPTRSRLFVLYCWPLSQLVFGHLTNRQLAPLLPNPIGSGLYLLQSNKVGIYVKIPLILSFKIIIKTRRFVFFSHSVNYASNS